MKSRMVCCLALICGLGLVLSPGCGGEGSNEQTAKNQKNEEKQGATQSSANTWPELTEEEKAEIAEALAELSEDDRALAAKQFICPVAEGPLGKMGTPVKVMVPTADGNETPVFICCEACRESLLADSEKYLAKLPK
ncbi:MAG: hypothetical protein MPJ50_03430 [Pirellulales bacterium]|nr:hypothetical protein [Pirellulales bacterium]